MLCKQIFQITLRKHLMMIEELFWFSVQFHLMITLEITRQSTLCILFNFGNVLSKQVGYKVLLSICITMWYTLKDMSWVCWMKSTNRNLAFLLSVVFYKNMVANLEASINKVSLNFRQAWNFSGFFTKIKFKYSHWLWCLVLNYSFFEIINKKIIK